jgi:hypothetical protein
MFSARVKISRVSWGASLRHIFLILGHDDFLLPDYITTLLDELIRRPQASVAYSDWACFGHAF